MRRIIALLVVLLIVGCGSTEAPAPVEPVAPEPAAPEPAVKAPEPVKVKVNTPEAQSILDNYGSKVKSYQFAYAPPPDNLVRDIYYVKGDKVKIELYETNVNPEGFYNTVYLDYSKKEALAVCEKRGRARCVDYLTPTPVKWSDHAITLPHTYMEEIKGAEVVGSETLYDRFAEKLSYKIGTKQYATWIDQYSAVPVKIVIGEGRNLPSIEFKELAINSVHDEDVVPQ